VNHVHSAHRATSVVEHPLLLDAQIRGDFWVSLERGDDVCHERTRVVTMFVDGIQGQRVQLLGREDVVAVEEATVDDLVDTVKTGVQEHDEGDQGDLGGVLHDFGTFGCFRHEV